MQAAYMCYVVGAVEQSSADKEDYVLDDILTTTAGVFGDPDADDACELDILVGFVFSIIM